MTHVNWFQKDSDEKPLRDAYAKGFRAGAEAMRADFAKLYDEDKMPDSSEAILALPLPNGEKE